MNAVGDAFGAGAAHAARLSVMPLERQGGQAQFIVRPLPPTPRGSTLEPLLMWLQGNLSRDITLTDMAVHAGKSPRTLIRHFRDQTGTTPLQWLHNTRIRQAQHLLETTSHTIERISAQVGFGSPTAFRDRFKRIRPRRVPPHVQRTVMSDGHRPAPASRATRDHSGSRYSPISPSANRGRTAPTAPPRRQAPGSGDRC
nr:helix-turn-helix domain-containing protein [Actinomadura soli]